jgi:hypothetical protein
MSMPVKTPVVAGSGVWPVSGSIMVTTSCRSVDPARASLKGSQWASVPSLLNRPAPWPMLSVSTVALAANGFVGSRSTFRYGTGVSSAAGNPMNGGWGTDTPA